MWQIREILSAVAVFVAVFVGLYVFYTPKAELPDSYWRHHYWGVPTKEEEGIVPVDGPGIHKFNIHVSDEILEDLKERLNKTRITKSYPGVNFEYGVHSDSLEDIVDYWLNDFDWRKQEKILNQYNHYHTEVEGMAIHFIHVKPSKAYKRVYPILMSHGWPGSVWELYKMIPLLIDPVDGVAFELVIPSIPGYGWSEAPQKAGLDLVHVARIYSKLMMRLGYKKYFYHGGDWGTMIGKAICILSPERILGFHTTMAFAKIDLKKVIKIAIGSVFPSLIYEDPELETKMMYPVAEKLTFLLRETGYAHIQATRPDTVGAALNDSPAGLASYIMEKFSVWSDRKNFLKEDGGLLDKFTLDELLTNVMIYWTTNSITTSQRFYKENANYKMFVKNQIDKVVISETVPIAIAVASEEYPSLSKTLIRDSYPNITQYTYHEGLGHFGGFEDPVAMVKDIRSFVAKAYGGQFIAYK